MNPACLAALFCFIALSAFQCVPSSEENQRNGIVACEVPTESPHANPGTPQTCVRR